MGNIHPRTPRIRIHQVSPEGIGRLLLLGLYRFPPSDAVPPAGPIWTSLGAYAGKDPDPQTPCGDCIAYARVGKQHKRRLQPVHATDGMARSNARLSPSAIRKTGRPRLCDRPENSGRKIELVYYVAL